MQSAHDIPIAILILKLIFLISHFFYLLWARLSAHTPTRAAPDRHTKCPETVNSDADCGVAGNDLTSHQLVN